MNSPHSVYRNRLCASLVLTTAVLAFTPVVALAQQSDLKGKPVTFRACVVQGIPSTTVRLTNVTEVGPAVANPSQPLQVVYWMDKTQEPQFKQHLGTKVEVAATIRDVPDKQVSELSSSDGVFGFETKMPAPAVVAASTAGAEPKPVGTSSATTETELESRLLRINVDKIRMVGTCP